MVVWVEESPTLTGRQNSFKTLIGIIGKRLRSQVAKAADCKSAIVGSTPTGASQQKTRFFLNIIRKTRGFFV